MIERKPEVVQRRPESLDQQRAALLVRLQQPRASLTVRQPQHGDLVASQRRPSRGTINFSTASEPSCIVDLGNQRLGRIREHSAHAKLPVTLDPGDQ